jgi:hypothetical protein
MNDFSPVAEYAFLSDCEDSYLIAPRKHPQAFAHRALIDAVSQLIEAQTKTP